MEMAALNLELSEQLELRGQFEATSAQALEDIDQLKVPALPGL
jgi:hypothetical protein